MWDRFHPSSLFASHQYLPWSCGATESTVNTDIALISLTLFLYTVRLSLNQVITGLGIPNALQLKFVFCPVATLSREIGWIRNLGFEGSAGEYTKCKEVSDKWNQTTINVLKCAFFWAQMCDISSSISLSSPTTINFAIAFVGCSSSSNTWYFIIIIRLLLQIMAEYCRIAKFGTLTEAISGSPFILTNLLCDKIYYSVWHKATDTINRILLSTEWRWIGTDSRVVRI